MFQPGLGEYKGFQTRIDVNPEATPRFHKARSVPYSQRALVDQELDRLVREGTLEPVDHSEWAALIMSVLKPDKKSVLICGDFRVTVNPVSKLNHYPILKVDDLFTTLQAGSTPSLPPATPGQGFQEVRRHQHSEGTIPIHPIALRYILCTWHIPTSHGELLKGILRVTVYIDDILIASD